jgi:TRAP-type C4-dicarboxylate transport system permease small subunit
MFLIVIAAVICRYLLHISMGGIDEFNYCFMTLVIWVGAAVTARNFEDGHIKVDLLGPFLKNKKIVAGMGMLWQVLSVGTIILFTELSWKYTFFNKQMNFTMAGISFPFWILYLLMSIFSVFISVYEVANLIRMIRKFIRPKTETATDPGSVAAGSDELQREAN